MINARKQSKRSISVGLPDLGLCSSVTLSLAKRLRHLFTTIGGSFMTIRGYNSTAIFFADSFLRVKNQTTADYFMKTENSQALYFKHPPSPKRIVLFTKTFPSLEIRMGQRRSVPQSEFWPPGLHVELEGKSRIFEPTVITTIEFRS
jgi:hypothetical protein